MLLVHANLDDTDIRYINSCKATTTENDDGCCIFVCTFLMKLIEGLSKLGNNKSYVLHDFLHDWNILF